MLEPKLESKARHPEIIYFVGEAHFYAAEVRKKMIFEYKHGVSSELVCKVCPSSDDGETGVNNMKSDESLNYELKGTWTTCVGRNGSAATSIGH